MREGGGGSRDNLQLTACTPVVPTNYCPCPPPFSQCKSMIMNSTMVMIKNIMMRASMKMMMIVTLWWL